MRSRLAEPRRRIRGYRQSTPAATALAHFGGRLTAEDEPHEAVHRGWIGPAEYRDDVRLGVDPGEVAAGAAGVIARLRRARIQRAVDVEPPEIAVLPENWAGLQHALDPFRRQDAPPTPDTALR